jgi:serine/threonine protein kinase
MTQAQGDPLIGTRIREYEILELLGKGGMGAVYRARHTYLEQERAIKVIHGKRTDDSGFVDRFIREARILTKLRHPHLIQLLEFGTLEEQSFFMVMELIRGESVLDRLRKIGRIPIPEAVKIMKEAASGLQCAHQNGIIHRDISPDNLILLTENDSQITKVIDFGIAKPLLESSLEVTATNLFIGKPEYCSPEQCTFSENKQPLDARSDIYSLAVTFYQMLTGNLPFHSKSPQGYFMKHAHELPDAPSVHFPPGSFPDSLDRLILKAMAKDREERHQDLGHFLAQLEAYNEQSLAIPLFSEPEIGELFAGRYWIEKKLGRGEMGMVFQAIDKILEIPVALKTISFDLAEDKKNLARFKREVVLARKVSHPNVCRVYDIGENSGVHYVSMELVEGKTLADHMRAQGPLPLEAALPILEQLLKAIRETHKAGIIHRDLKPQNIMIDSQFRLKIMDFGISLSPDFSRITQTGSLVGTPHYMAPEVFEEKPVNHRADIYSFGVLMYTLFTGRLPFDGPTPIAVIYAHLKGDAPKPSDVIPAFSPNLERIILKTLQKNPEDRYATADQILQDLEMLIQPSSDPRLQASEQLTHKLIAEHRYGKALKVLQSLLEDQPDHPQWKKLYKNALAEKTKKDIRRTRLLIKKQNWMQAEFYLERIGGQQLEGTGVLKQVKKLQELLFSGKRQAVDQHIQDADQRLSAKDYIAAMASLESAWHLQPNDPAIITMQQKIQLAQETELNEKHDAKLEEARRLQIDGQDGDAFTIIQEILKENPSHRLAKELSEQILDQRWQIVQNQIRQDLELAMQPLSFCDFEVALDLLTKLKKTIEIDSCRKEMERIRKAVASLDVSFRSEQYYDVQGIIEKLLAKDPFGWLEAHRGTFVEIENTAAEKLSSRQMAMMDVLSRSKTFAQQNRYVEALDLLKQWSGTEAEALRSEILYEYRDWKMQEAQRHAAQMEWEDAIDCWKEMLHFFPDATDIQQAITQAENHVVAEIQIQQELLRRLKNCYSLVLKEEWADALALTEKMLDSIEPGFRLIELEKQIETLRSEILKQNVKQQTHLDAIASELAEIRQLYKTGSYPEALERISLILETDYVREEALELKASIEKAIQTQAVSMKFQSTIQKGKEYFEQQNWQKAIELWKRAVALSDETYLKDWIEQAEQKLKKERQSRLSMIAMLAEADELIFYNKFSDARRKLEKCKKVLQEQSSFEDLAEQFRNIAQKLAKEMQKEEALQIALHTEIEEAEVLYQQKLYEEALRKVEAVLEQKPEMESALKLKAATEVARGVERSVLEILKAVVKLVVKRAFKHLPALLIRLKETSLSTAYAEDCASIVDELPLLVLEIESGDQISAKERLDRLFSRSLLLLEYETTLRDFVETLDTRNRKEIQLEEVLASGLESLESRDREGVLDCLDRFHEVLTGKMQRKSFPAEHLDRTATLSDDDLKLTEFELQSLQDSLMHHEVETILKAAKKVLEQGDKHRAEELFQQALRIEPDNAVAQEGLRLSQEKS